jgi:hypothetical protein
MLELERTVPLIGRPHAAQLNRMWASIQSDMAHSREAQWGFSLRYGFAALALLLVLLLPWTLGSGRVALAIPSQPAPHLIAAETPDSTEPAVAPTAIALNTSTEHPTTPPAQLPHRAPAPETLTTP